MAPLKASTIINDLSASLGDPPQGEGLDLHLLNTAVKPHYQPSPEPWIMDVDASGRKEARVLRTFHRMSYGIQDGLAKVIAANNLQIPNIARFLDDYDEYLSGFDGDARQEFTWVQAFIHTNCGRNQYDMTYIFNPDLVQLENWAMVFNNGLIFTRPEGALVTIIREDDLGYYQRLLNVLEAKYGIKPVESRPTEIINDDGSPNFHHTIGVFKPKR